MTLLAPWVFECRGRGRPGDRPGLAGIHHWRRQPDRTAVCLKCGVVLSVEDADDCFTQR